MVNLTRMWYLEVLTAMRSQKGLKRGSTGETELGSYHRKIVLKLKESDPLAH